MDDQELRQTLQRLEEQQEKIISELARVEGKRDFWDKLSAISPILSGVAIALSALLCTYQYNQQQIKLQEAQTVEKFIPHLMGNDTSKRMAILAMKTLVNTDLAAKYAAMFPSAGAISALKTIAKTGDSQDKRIVSEFLHKTADEQSDSKGKTIDSVDVIEEPTVDVIVKPEHADAPKPASTDAAAAAAGPGDTKSDQKVDTKGDTNPPADKGRSHAKEHPVTTDEKDAVETQSKHDPETRPNHVDGTKSTTAHEDSTLGL